MPTKREEIREGLKGIVGNITEGGEDGDELRCEDWNGDWARCILNYLRSAGCVLKVERELPKCEVEYNPMACGAEDDTDNCYRSGWDSSQEVMLGAGYVAVEPLIEK